MGLTVEASEFTVSDLQWSTLGSPALSFILTYRGPKMFTSCRYEAYGDTKIISAGDLNGSFSTGCPTRTSVVLPLGTENIARLSLFAV